MPATEQQIFAVADEFHDIISQKLTGPAGLHAVTAIAAAGRMAGTYALRSFQRHLDPVEPGALVLSEAANEKGLALIALLGRTLAHFGVHVSPAQLRPPGSGAERPNLDVLGTQRLVERDLCQIQKVHGLSCEEAALAAVVCGAMFIRESVVFVSEGDAYSLAAYSVVEGLKTAPQAIDLVFPAPARKRWWGRRQAG